jgi:diacylglycerol kinase (ATP)
LANTDLCDEYGKKLRFLFSYFISNNMGMKKNGEDICFIYNPSAGRGRTGSYLDRIRNKAEEYWENPEFRITQKESDIEEFARSAAQDFDLVVGCGGDGTMNLVVNGIAGSNAHLGVLPLGNGNDFAKAIGLPGDPLKALELIRTGKRGTLDLIRCRGDSETWCVNTLGIGLDGWANYYASQYQNVRGQAVYVLGILKAVYHFRGSNMRLIIDEEKMDKQLLMVTVCNGPEEGGGFKVAPGASNSDGLIDLLTIEKMSVARILWYLPKFLFQPGKKLKGVRRVRCKKVTIESETPVAVHCDGQGLGTDIETISAEIRPGILQVIVP